MAATVKIVDQTTFNWGRSDDSFTLVLPEDVISARELIRRRVLKEVEAYNARLPGLFNGLIQPEGAEQTLNGFRLPKQRPIDAEAQVLKALDAFQHNGFILLINGQQVEDLDSQVAVTDALTVTFFKLLPLVGG